MESLIIILLAVLIPNGEQIKEWCKEEQKCIENGDGIPMPEVKLTKREMEIARLTAQGKLNKEIADELGISVGTVSVHKNNLFRKLGIGNTIELMRYMQKVGL